MILRFITFYYDLFLDKGDFAGPGFSDDSGRGIRIGYPRMINWDPMYTT